MALAEIAEWNNQYGAHSRDHDEEKSVPVVLGPKKVTAKNALYAHAGALEYGILLPSKIYTKTSPATTAKTTSNKPLTVAPTLLRKLDAVVFMAILVVASSLMVFLTELASPQPRFLIPSFVATLLFTVVLGVSATVKKRLARHQ